MQNFRSNSHNRSVLLVHVLYGPDVAAAEDHVVVEVVEGRCRLEVSVEMFNSTSLSTLLVGIVHLPAILGPGNFASGLKYRRYTTSGMK